jgi:Na+/H+-dicarboxylate symporter
MIIKFSFFFPLKSKGATVNMNGTALYEAVAVIGKFNILFKLIIKILFKKVIFIAQLNNRELSFVDLVIARFYTFS